MAHRLTEEQYQEVLHLSSILFLGFLLPYSTGNEQRLLGNVNRESDFFPSSNPAMTISSDTTKTKFDPVECVLNMSLVDRLDQLSTVSNIRKECGMEMDVLTDTRFELAYQDFMYQGLLPLLVARPIDREQVDLLHLIAMVICPQPDVDTDRKDNNSNNLTRKAQQLMRHVMAPEFHVHYGHRMELVRLIAQQQAVVLPCLSLDGDYDVSPTGPLLMGALPHLQSSLLQFAKSSALTPQDSHTAYAALVALSTQTKHLPLIAQTWKIILHRIVENPAKYTRLKEPLSITPVTDFWLSNDQDSTEQFCSHAICGQLLAATVVRSGSDLAAMALTSLSDTIEWQIDAWTKDEQEEPDKEHPAAPSLLMALLFTARHAILVSKRQDLDEDTVGTLVDCVLLLLRHPVTIIRTEAVRLLETAFASSVDPVPHSGVLLETIKRSLNDELLLDGLHRLVQIVVPRSTEFTRQLYECLLNQESGAVLRRPASRLLSAICTNHPPVLLKNDEGIQEQMELAEPGSPLVMDMVSSALTARQTHYFVSPGNVDSKSKSHLEYIAVKGGTLWDLYRLACFAMTVGDFSFAKQGFANLVTRNSLNEDHMLWISALEHVACAESLLAVEASTAMPEASCHLHTALSYIHHIHHTISFLECDGERVSYAFQSRYLLLRLDQLDLITVVRHLTRETRLTGSVPPKNTRHFQHLMGAVRNLYSLANRYQELNQQYGVQFQSGMSTTCLLAQRDLCVFLAKSTEVAFDEVFSSTSLSKSNKADKESPRRERNTDSSLLVNKLIYELKCHVIPAMKDTMEPLVRAAAMLELLDAVLMVPCPFPRDFYSPRSIPLAELHLTPLASEVFEYGAKSTANHLDRIESHPSISSTLNVHGQIPTQIMKKARYPITAVVLWCHILYVLASDDDAPATTAGAEEVLVSREAVESRLPQFTRPYSNFDLLADGRFHGTVELPPLVDEGLFVFETKPGCRDTRGIEWELHVAPESRRISIHCSRSV